jgi:hydroxyacylglutathione hydrolase
VDNPINVINLGFVNAYLLHCGNQLVLIDTGTDKTGKRIISYLKKKNLSPADISYIILTHAHSDHCAAAPFLKSLGNAKIICHENSVKYYEQQSSAPVIGHGFPAALLGKILPTGLPATTADITFDKELDLNKYVIPAKLYHTPGHTDDSLSLIYMDKHLFIGDMIRGGRHKLKPGMFYISKNELTESLNQLCALRPETVYLSHGSKTDLPQLEKFIQSL